MSRLPFLGGPVQSSTIDEVAYDDGNACLWVRFRSGSVYRYGTVPRDTVEKMLQAASTGSFFATHIRNIYPATKINQVAFDDVVRRLQPRFVLTLPGLCERGFWEMSLAA